MKGGGFALFRCFCFLFFCQIVFAAIPIQEKAFQGAASTEARLKLLSIAESYLGVPYRYSGLDRNGLDCSGLAYICFRDGLKVTIPRTADRIYAWTEKIDTKELQPGDLVFFVTSGSTVSHVGIYAGEGMFIHAASEGPRTGVMYSRLDESYWNRTYRGAGRALPWDEMAAQTMAAARPGGNSGGSSTAEYPGRGNTGPVQQEPVRAGSGFFTGFGAAWTWGGFFQGANSPFRGISTFASVGHKWSKYRAALELRPEWDNALGIFRLPLTISFGTDIFQVFAGPAYTFGEPSLSIDNQNQYYSGGGAWLWEAGLSAAILPIKFSQGLISLYGELAWQPYHWESGESFSFKSNITANLRASTGLRYLRYIW